MMQLFSEIKEDVFSTGSYRVLPRRFYLNDTVSVAMELLGKFIIKKEKNSFIAGKITETEAYLGDNDPACHAYRRVTPRNSVMFEDGGLSYVYFIYGNYYCFNAVTGRKGTGSAVLIRAVEPVAGISLMLKRRGKIKNIHDLTNGPAKLCLAFGIDRKLNGARLDSGEFFIAGKSKKETISVVTTKRIGIKEGAEFPYRFFMKNNPYVSKHKFNNEIISETTL